MKENLLDVFITYLSEDLTFYNLGFKKNISKGLRNQPLISYSVTNEPDSLPFDHAFLKKYFLSYYYTLNRHCENLVPNLMHKLLINHSDLLFTQLSSLPVFQKDSSALNKRSSRGIEDFFPALEYSFASEDLLIYFKNYKDKNLFSPNYYSFSRLLREVTTRFKEEALYEEILLHIFELHSVLIKKTSGNIIAIRSWCLNNLFHPEKFESFFTIEDNESLLVTLPYQTCLKFINLKTVQNNFLLNDATGNGSYHQFLKSFVHILNFPEIKKELKIERAEGFFIFDKKTFQITFFSQNVLNDVTIDKNIAILLEVLCHYSNMTNKNIDDMENQIFKGFQYHLLNNKLVPLGHKTEKVGKI